MQEPFAIYEKSLINFSMLYFKLLFTKFHIVIQIWINKYKNEVSNFSIVS